MRKTMNKDRVFADKKKEIKPFEFNQKVAQVFNDMLNRSVPLYQENILRLAQLARYFYKPGSRMYDLGCSNGNLGIQILTLFENQRFEMIGVDNSNPMIEKYSQRLKKFMHPDRIELICDRMENIVIRNASVVFINLTLQFLDVDARDGMIRSVYEGLLPGGVLLMTEKTVHPEKELDELEKLIYQAFKRENGYSELEISQKREALEKVLVPDTVNTHMARLKQAGFSKVDVWLKWFNFCSMIAVK